MQVLAVSRQVAAVDRIVSRHDWPHDCRVLVAVLQASNVLLGLHAACAAVICVAHVLSMQVSAVARALSRQLRASTTPLMRL